MMFDPRRLLDGRLAICAVVSVAAHFALARALDELPHRETPPPPPIVQVHVVEPPQPPEPPPEPPKPPEPPPEPPRPIKQVHERPRERPPVKQDVQPVDTPPVDHPPVTTDTTTTPAFGVTMESTSQAGGGPAVPVGNTTRPAPARAPGAPVKPLLEPVSPAEVTRMPVPTDRCKGLGKYTAEARAAGVEGLVVLDLIVDEHGRAHDITVVQGLPHGLTEAAVAALTACQFTIGERNGVPVAVRVRGMKIRFYLAEGS